MMTVAVVTWIVMETMASTSPWRSSRACSRPTLSGARTCITRMMVLAMEWIRQVRAAMAMATLLALALMAIKKSI
jgi:predicted nucleic acid-binding Zn ribbon protein